MKFALVFFVMYMSIGVNLPDGIIGRLGVDPNYLIGALIAFALAKGKPTCREIWPSAA